MNSVRDPLISSSHVNWIPRVATAWQMKATANMLYKQTLDSSQSLIKKRQAMLRIKQASDLNVSCVTTYLWFYSPPLGLGRFFTFPIFTQSVGLHT
jgi:hypothetical protein